MHVLFLTPDLFGPGGIARHGRIVCQALLESGAQVDALALNDSSAPGAAGAQPMLDSPRMHHVGCDGNRKTFVRRALSLSARRPSLVLVEHVNFSPLGWIVARRARAPWAFVAHGVEVWSPLSSLRQTSLRRADQIICVSHFTARRIVEANGAPAKRTRVLHNCLDPFFGFAPAPQTPSRPSLLTVGRMNLSEQYKGHNYVIRALPLLLARFPDLVYNVIGDGEGRPKLQHLACELGVENSVRWQARVSDEELARAYAQASLFIMPSQNEGFGLVFVEAMAQGVPAIGGNTDATPEVIADGETGFVVNPTSVEQIAEKTALLLGDSSLRDRMGRAAIARVEGNFSFPLFKARLRERLGELHPGPKNSSPLPDDKFPGAA